MDNGYTVVRVGFYLLTVSFSNLWSSNLHRSSDQSHGYFKRQAFVVPCCVISCFTVPIL